jgi:flagellar biosynthesis protein FlhF
MRLKSYSAPSMAEAMALVRAELGDDAIIVSTQRASGGQGVRITAALEEATSDDEIHEALSGSRPSPVADAVRDQFVYHGLPPRLIERLVRAARGVDTANPTMACAGALDEAFAFAALPERKAPRPFMLIGPPGSGKTITVAKLAARARLAGRAVAVISADTVRAGALEQLSAFTSILEIDLQKARGPAQLRRLIDDTILVHDLVYVDTPGINPFNAGDVDYLRELIAAVDVEPVMVMAAGGDPVEACEMAEVFAGLGATRLLATRLDMTRRLGAVLGAADAGQFMICEVSINPHVANGLCMITPVSMARLLVPPTDHEQGGGGEDDGPARMPSPVPPPVENTYAGAWDTAPHDTLDDEDAGDLPPPEAEDRPLFGFAADPDAGSEDDPRPDRMNEAR